MRFHEHNINGQCTSCNKFKSGNLTEYRIALVEKIGEDRVKWLEDNRRVVKRWKRWELEEMIEKVEDLTEFTINLREAIERSK